MHRGNIRILILMTIAAALLSACNGRPTAAQVKADGQAYAEKSDADQRAFNMEQQRQFEQDLHTADMSKIAYWQALRAKWEPFVFALGKFVIWSSYLVVVALALSTSAGVSVFSYSTFKSAARFIEIRSGVMPIDRETRLPRALIYDTPQSPATNSWLAKVQNRTGLGFYNANGSKWTVVNAANGNIIARFDENTSPDLNQLEVERQALLHWQTTRQQKDSGLFSAHGEVANAIGIADPSIPGQPVHMEFNELVKKVLQELKHELAD